MRPLLGRHEELRALRAEAGPTRVWGPAGVGKTHLVRSAFPTAIHCDLTECRSEADITRALATALEMHHDAWLHGTVPIVVAVTRRLQHETRPVVLDGADACLEELAAMTKQWKGPRFISTARRANFAIRSIEVGPLGLPDAVALWQLHVPESELEVAEAIVERLDRLPLAIEWVAARAALLGERICLARVRSGAFESDPLASALDESLDTLQPEQRAALERICAFRSGFDVEHLDSIGDLGVVEHLRSIALVLRTGQRVRGYRSVIRRVHERASEEDWNDAIQRHAIMTLERVESCPELANDEWEELEIIQTRFMSRIESSRESDINPDSELAARAALMALPRALSTGRIDQTRTRLLDLVQRVDLQRVPDLHLALARLERRAGQFDRAQDHARSALKDRPFDAELELAHLDRQQSRLDRAHDRLVTALERARDAKRVLLPNAVREESIALGELGRVLQSLGRYREAQARHVEAIALCRTSRSKRREALERSLHARATHRAGDVADAIGLHQSALDLHLQLGDLRLASAERGHLAFCHHELARFDEAESLFRESIEGLARAGDIVLEHIERVLLARLLGDVGRTAEARLELGIAKAIDRDVAMPRLEFTRRLVAAWVHVADTRLQDAERELDTALGLGVHVEVGFEALAGATLGAIRSKLGRAPDEFTPLVTETPGLAQAFEVLDAIRRGAPTPAVSRANLGRSSDLRRALTFAGRTGRTLKVAEDGRSFGYASAHEVDLSRRAAPRRLLALLGGKRRDHPGIACTRDELIAAGWPEEKMHAGAADKRLRTAIWTLRKAGLEEALLTRDEGYLLDPHLQVELV